MGSGVFRDIRAYSPLFFPKTGYLSLFCHGRRYCQGCQSLLRGISSSSSIHILMPTMLSLRSELEVLHKINEHSKQMLRIASAYPASKPSLVATHVPTSYDFTLPVPKPLLDPSVTGELDETIAQQLSDTLMSASMRLKTRFEDQLQQVHSVLAMQGGHTSSLKLHSTFHFLYVKMTAAWRRHIVHNLIPRILAARVRAASEQTSGALKPVFNHVRVSSSSITVIPTQVFYIGRRPTPRAVLRSECFPLAPRQVRAGIPNRNGVQTDTCMGALTTFI